MAKTEFEAKKDIIRDQVSSGNQRDALKHIRVLLRAHPEDAELHLLHGFTQMSLRNPVVAVQAIRKAYSLDPSPANGLNLSSAYIEAGEYQKARQLLAALLKKDRGEKKNAYLFPERLYHNVGLSFYREKKHREAEKFFKRALEDNPAYILSNFLLAKLYEETGRKPLARQTYQQILEQCPACYDPMHALVMSCLAAGLHKQAGGVISKYLQNSKLEEVDITRAKDLKRLVMQVTGDRSPAKPVPRERM